MANKKLFVCLPIEDESLEGAVTKQQQAAMDLEAQTGETYDLIDYIEASLFVVHPIKSTAKALTALADADVVVCLPGWEKSNICKVIRLCADGYRIRTLVLDKA